jgi:hypothetical protein
VSSADLTAPLSARTFLLGEDAGVDTAEVLARSLSESNVTQSAIQGLCGLPVSVLQTVDREVATVADGLLDVGLGDILSSGWSTYSDLTNAAKRTLASPASEEVVVLTTHSVVSTHHPSVDLIVDGVKVHTFVFELKVELNLSGIVAVVQRGNLVALRGGECVVTATLTVEGTPLELSREGRIDLALFVRLHLPIPLTWEGHHPPISRFDRSAPGSSRS